MKNSNIYLSFLVLFSLILGSCSEEIKPSTDGKQTAIVYALLNANDSIHYVKINRAMDASGDLSQSALIPDSSYFDQVDATVTEVIGGVVKRTWILKDTMIENKEAGAFYYPLQKVYYFKTSSADPLLVGTTTIYKLEANINNGEFAVKGETALVGGLTITAPSDIASFPFVSNNFAQDGYSYGTVSYNPGNCKKVEIFFDIEFEEYDNATLLNTKKVQWKIADLSSDDELWAKPQNAFGQTFYELIAQNVTKDNPAINKRKLKGINIRMYGASDVYEKYVLVNKPSSSLAQNKPTYTNLTASNEMRVFGIFTSSTNVERYKDAWKYAGGASYYTCLNTNSMRQLCDGAITGQYMFCSDNPVDSGQSFFCN
ncbi:MAG: hypothetical protein ACK5B9_14530 [Flavobacteriia bacterium]|jgi:hypothetical protein